MVCWKTPGHPIWNGRGGWGILRQQLAVDHVGGRHLALLVADGDVLRNRTATVSVVCRVGCDGFSVAGNGCVHLVDELVVVVVGLHTSSFKSSCPAVVPLFSRKVLAVELFGVFLFDHSNFAISPPYG